MELIKIVMVEDDPGHARLIEKNLRRSGIANEIVAIANGQGIFDYFDQIYGEQRELEQLLILLDLNLPVLDGYQVLARLKSDERTKKIPVIVLTTTDVPHEVKKCYELGCNLFISKPIQYDQFCNTIHNLGLLLSITKIPSC